MTACAPSRGPAPPAPVPNLVHHISRRAPCGVVPARVAALGPVGGIRPRRAPIRWQSCAAGLECGLGHGARRLRRPRRRADQDRDLASARAGPGHRTRIVAVQLRGPGDPGAETLRRLRRSSVPRASAATATTWCASIHAAPAGPGHRLPQRHGGRPAARRGPDARDRRGAARSSTRGRRRRRLRAGVHRQERLMAGTGREPQCRPRPRSPACRARCRLGSTISGYSYGTVIGSVYAQEFPDRVGRLVLDGPVSFSDRPEQTIGRRRPPASSTRSTRSSPTAPRTTTARSNRTASRGLRSARSRRGSSAAWSSPPRREGRGGRTAGVAAFYTGVLWSLYDRSTAGLNSPTRWPTRVTATARAPGARRRVQRPAP